MTHVLVAHARARRKMVLEHVLVKCKNLVLSARARQKAGARCSCSSPSTKCSSTANHWYKVIIKSYILLRLYMYVCMYSQGINSVPLKSIILIRLKSIVIKSLSKCESDLNYKQIQKSYQIYI